MLFIAFCACICGCETVTTYIEDLFSGEDEVLPVEVDSATIYNPEGPRIRIGVGLIVQLSVTGLQPQTMEVLVDQNGEVTLPHLLREPVKCDGLTLEAFRQKLVKQYLEFYKQPQVTVRFAPYDQVNGVSPYGTIRVMGQVSRQGPVNLPPTMDMTVTKAVQAAGGLKPFANKRRIRVIRREQDGRLLKARIDWDEIGEEGRLEKDMVLRAGDVIWVPETTW